MIESLSGTIFYILPILIYIAITLFAGVQLGIFNVIRNTNPVIFIKTKFNSIKLINDFKINYWNKSNNLITSFLASVKNRFIVPIFKLFLRILNYASAKLDWIEYIFEYHTSKGFKEAFTEISLVIRNAVMSEVQNVWSLILLIFVIFYIILTT